MTTAYDIDATALGFMSQFLGAPVRPTDDIPLEQCDWCGNEGALTKVRVTAVPNPHETTEDFIKECCHHCSKHVVDRGKELHWDRAGRDVLVEVSL